VSSGFQLRAPWYVREARHLTLLDAAAKRPAIQMYDTPDLPTRLKADPGDSLEFGLDDRWSYPVPVTPSPTAKGRDKFVTSKLVHTKLRKLYQPAHSRFYAVVVEVFCDSPGLPRAGSHSDIDVTFVMRRQHTTVAGGTRSVRRLARTLLAELAKEQHELEALPAPDLDVGDLWWADEAHRVQFELDNAGLVKEVQADTGEQAWMVDAAGGRWRTVGEAPDPTRPRETEEQLPMWRLPPRPEDCAAAQTRSLWFGLVPTYSAEHWTDDQKVLQTKLDEHAIYQLRCIVTQRRPPGQEHCPPIADISEPSRPLRLAAAFDPDGTKNRTISITAPDLRRLAARAGQKQGPGGLRISTPPNSALPPVDFKSIPNAGIGKVGAGGSICTFAFELFFIVALFLFLLFLPIIVLAFQLWWMLALRFCIPPSISFSALAQFFAGGGLLTNLVPGPSPPFDAAHSADLDAAVGVPNAAAALLAGGADFVGHDADVGDLVAGINPEDAQTTPVPPVHRVTPPDPLCPHP